MNKNCDNCYWKDYKNMFCINETSRPKESICNKHRFSCSKCYCSSEYSLNGKYYCTDCLLSEFEVEESTVTHYYQDGEYIGSNEDIDEVVSNLDEDIEIL